MSELISYPADQSAAMLQPVAAAAVSGPSASGAGEVVHSVRVASDVLF